MKYWKSLLTMGLLCVALNAFGQNYLKDHQIKVQTFDAIDSNRLSQHIDSIADNARIIGLGEVSHYTKECYLFKAAIIKQLIAKGYQGLVLEVDFGQALLWNNYVTKGIGNLDDLIAESGWFTYRTEEFKALVAAIRNHNESTATPFQIFGMEMTAINHNLAWLINYFKDLPDSADLMTALQEERPIVAFQQHTEAQVLSYWNLYYSVKNQLEASQDQLIEAHGVQDFAIAQRLAEILRQYATYVAQDEFFLQVELRDQFSARNVLWTLEQLGEDSKIAIWAHNGHVVKKSVLFEYDILGYYLSNWFEQDYYSIGFTFNSGSFGAFGSQGFQEWELPEVTDVSVTKELGALDSPYTLVDLRTSLDRMDAQTREALGVPVPIRSDVSESYTPGGDGLMELNLSNSYDALIYIDKTSYPTTIPWKR
ncbi:erythromycin esterase family protein [Gilvibacter sp.]|uniref:erythromycin esterase family protein n=1 Tax=Gilvibacter sp. TaxID=2729997 RepID=UPI003F4A2CFC